MPTGGPREAALHPLRRFIEPLANADERFRDAGLDPEDADSPPDVPGEWFEELICLLDGAADLLDGLQESRSAAELRTYKRMAEERAELPVDRSRLMNFLVARLHIFLTGGTITRETPQGAGGDTRSDLNGDAAFDLEKVESTPSRLPTGLCGSVASTDLGALVRWRRVELEEWIAEGCRPVRVVAARGVQR